MNERMVWTDGLELAAQSIGNANRPPGRRLPERNEPRQPEDRNAWRGRLHETKPPLLVIHGAADPVYPIEHGAAVAGASLVTLEGRGHELHPAHWDTIITAIVTHIAR